ncbi:hypothetical protein ACQEU5_23620 [Marinactinospora thermotolerans]|uniref:Uncharacterized protein n=1 Tax=Marinactinospora thermotolerans DSM 45154 TaxID=1122192 RepID=A0A1T4K6P1_9ACTN|nr:hypothetical protein [Marinactinospora thermotolerans]SJZ37993.1 hypothetical protein SAMN02745673_00188 [Marinactinospora thermotolerans DSM 45154]
MPDHDDWAGMTDEELLDVTSELIEQRPEPPEITALVRAIAHAGTSPPDPFAR